MAEGFSPIYLNALPTEVRRECQRLLQNYINYQTRWPEAAEPLTKIEYKRSACERSLLYFVNQMHEKTVRQVKLQLLIKDPKYAENGIIHLGFHGMLLCLFQLMIEKKWHMSTIAPRDFGKSIDFSTFGLEWLALQPQRGRGQSPEMVYVSASGEYAISRGAFVQNDFETNADIIAHWGSQKVPGRKWNEDHIHLANGTHIYFKGYGKQTRGPHPWFVLIDDIESRATAESETMTTTIKDWFNFDFYGQLEPGDVLHVNGTNCGPDTFIDNIHRDPTTGHARAGFVCFKFRACNCAAVAGTYEPEFPGDLPYVITNSIWPKKFTNKELKKKLNTIGPYAFDSEYQGEPHGSNEPVIRPEWIADNEIDECEVPLQSECDVLIAYDPAYSVKTWADPTGWSELWVPQSGPYKHRFIVYDALDGKMTTQEKIDHIYMMQLLRSPKQISLEEDGDHGVLIQSILRESVARQSYPNVLAVKSGGKDKVTRASSVQALFQSGTVMFIRGKNQKAKEQLTRIQDPKYPDDIADAIVYNVKVAQTYYMPEAGSKAPKKEVPLAVSWRQQRFQEHLKNNAKGAKLINPITGERICFPNS